MLLAIVAEHASCTDQVATSQHVLCISLLAVAFLGLRLLDQPEQTVSGGVQACWFACAEQLFERLLSFELWFRRACVRVET